jgi:IclR family pca regulon transcriptional regulator
MATQLNNSVARAFAILELFTERRPKVTAGDVVRELGLNAVTAHRFLRSLEAVGAVVAETRGTYRLGYLFADLGNRVMVGNALAQACQPALDGLSRDIKEASMATVMETNMVSCIAVAMAGRTLSVHVRPGTRMAPYCVANGKVWLAHLPEEELDRYLDQANLKAVTARTITDREALKEDLEKVRERGFALNDGEREEGLRAVAIPLIGRNRTLLAGLSVFGPTSRMSDAVVEKALDRLREAAREIENRLYGRAAA